MSEMNTIETIDNNINTINTTEVEQNESASVNDFFGIADINLDQTPAEAEPVPTMAACAASGVGGALMGAGITWFFMRDRKTPEEKKAAKEEKKQQKEAKRKEKEEKTKGIVDRMYDPLISRLEKRGLVTRVEPEKEEDVQEIKDPEPTEPAKGKNNKK